MVGEGIDWDKVQAKPDKAQKVPGTTLLGMRDAINSSKAEIERLKAEVSTLSGAKSDLEGKVSKLESDVTTRDETISGLEAELSSVKDNLGSIQREKEVQRDSLERERDGLKQDLEEKLDLAGERLRGIEEKLFLTQAGKNRLVADYLSREANLEKTISDLEHEKRLLVDKIVLMETQGVTPKAEIEAKMLIASTTIAADNNVRACVTCRQYVELVEGKYEYQRAMAIFEGHHRGHMLSTITMSEVPRGFTAVTEEFLHLVS
ncbi:MAG: hypothetical protein ACTSUE_21570 [Promethearchaeota archaeon]